MTQAETYQWLVEYFGYKNNDPIAVVIIHTLDPNKQPRPETVKKAFISLRTKMDWNDVQSWNATKTNRS